jgi:hypothetical protein
MFYFYFGKNLIISIVVSKVSEYYYISVGINFFNKKTLKTKQIINLKNQQYTLFFFYKIKIMFLIQNLSRFESKTYYYEESYK